MRRASASSEVANGWNLFAHPVFLAQLETLTRQVEVLRTRDPVGYTKRNAAKRLAAIRKLMFDVIPEDPSRVEFRQGGTLGALHKHWFRAKFLQQYRLFFRFHAASKVILYAWVNDDSTLRAFESDNDAYKVFRRMLKRGHPPDDWEELLAESSQLR